MSANCDRVRDDRFTWKDAGNLRNAVKVAFLSMTASRPITDIFDCGQLTEKRTFLLRRPSTVPVKVDFRPATKNARFVHDLHFESVAISPLSILACADWLY